MLNRGTTGPTRIMPGIPNLDPRSLYLLLNKPARIASSLSGGEPRHVHTRGQPLNRNRLIRLIDLIQLQLTRG